MGKKDGDWFFPSGSPPFGTWYSCRSRDGTDGVAETGGYSKNLFPFPFGHTKSLPFPDSFLVIYGHVTEFWPTGCEWIDIYSRNT